MINKIKILCVVFLCTFFAIIPAKATVAVTEVICDALHFGGDPQNFYILYHQYYAIDTPETDNNVLAIRMIDFFHDLEFQKFTNKTQATKTLYQTTFPSAHLMVEPSVFYNCHSYAWHSQRYLINDYWINEPDGYIQESGCYEVVGTPQKGDIICYYNDNGTPNNYSDDKNVHSGIVVGVVSGATSNGQCGNSNTVTVQSKWGLNGLYQHNGYECPYTNFGNSVANSTFSNSDPADYVKYYRNHTHSHTSCSQLTSGDPLYNDYHKKVCSCGQIIYEAHQIGNAPNAMNPSEEFPPNYIVPLRCIYCGYEPTRLTY